MVTVRICVCTVRMAYYKSHLLLRMVGFFGPDSSTPVDTWSCGLRIDIGSAGIWDEADKATFLAAIEGDASTYHTDPGTGANGRAWLLELQAAYVDTDGKWIGGGDQPTTIHRYDPPVVGAAGNGVTWDMACVVGLRTALARGRGHRGRYYYPCGEIVQMDGRFSTAVQSGLLGTSKTFLDAVNAAAKSIWTDGDGICVFSPLGAIPQIVTDVEVGRAPDTQRRRTRSLIEDYSTLPLAGVLSASEARSKLVYRASR